MALRISFLIALLCLLLPAAAPAADIIVKRDSGLSRAERSDIRSEAGVEFERSLKIKNYELVSVADDKLSEALTTLNQDSDVQFAEKDGRVHSQAAPPFRFAANDPGFSQQYAIYNSGQVIYDTAGTAGADMNVRFAWNLSLGSSVNIAVVDGGVQTDHPDLVGQRGSNSGEIASNGIDDDANGYVDDTSGYDFVSRDNNPSAEDDGHGTHVAGIIAAKRNNGIGIAGVAPSSHYIPLRVLDSSGSGNWSDVIEAFAYAGKMGYPVVNASLGSSGTISSIDDVISQYPNTLYVVAAGNDNRDLDSNNFYPCEAGIAGKPAADNNTLCVASSDYNDAKSSFSNYSSSGAAVDIAAPGDMIIATYPTSQYAYLSGTSMASPNAAAVASLIYSADNSKKGSSLKSTIVNNGQSKAGLVGVVGHGRVDALAALLSVAPDSDSDGVADSLDLCPVLYSADTGGCPDTDQDTVADITDNCPSVVNSDQADDDSDGQGNACDTTPRGADSDLDGLAQLDDNCPAVKNADQADDDKDGQGNACDTTPRGADSDGDGIGALDDNCPGTSNTNQSDRDGDGIGDSCDSAPDGTIANPPTNPPTNPSPDPSPTVDSDSDGFSDNLDSCPSQSGTVAGCPVPAIEKLKVSKKKKRMFASISVDRDSSVTLTLERQSCRKGKCSYRSFGKAITVDVFSSQKSKVSLGKLSKGKYRLRAIASISSAQSDEKTVKFNS